MARPTGEGRRAVGRVELGPHALLGARLRVEALREAALLELRDELAGRSVAEAARRLGVPVRTVWGWIARHGVRVGA